MRLKNLLKSTFREILSRKRLFVCITVILIISFIIIDYSLIILGSVVARETVVRNLTNGDSDRVYFLNLDKYTLLLGDTSERLVELLNRIEQMEKVECAGTYYDNENFSVNDQEMFILVVSESLSDLCNVESTEGEKLDLSDTDGYPAIAAGYNLGKDYPVGTLVTDDYSGVTYIVKQVLKKNSRWLDESVKNGVYVDLDNQFLLGMENILKGDNIFIGNGLNNFCYRISAETDGEEIKKQVEECAESLNIEIYSIHSLTEQAQWGYRNLNEMKQELYLSVFLFFTAILAMLTASMITINIRKKDIGILYANGYSGKDVMIMYILENGIKIVIAFLVASAYWSIQQYHIFGWNTSIMWILIPWSVIAALLMLGAGSIVPLLQIKKQRPVELIRIR